MNSRRLIDHLVGAGEQRRQAAPLNMAQQHENEDDNQNDADRAGRAVAPPGAMRPAGNGTQQEQNEDNDKDGAKHLKNSSPGIVGGAADPSLLPTQ
jgi:hypothetical protein